jgi:hypothetical protein
MADMLEELAAELGQALPKIVVTCSAASLSMRPSEHDAAGSLLVSIRPSTYVLLL